MAGSGTTPDGHIQYDPRYLTKQAAESADKDWNFWGPLGAQITEAVVKANPGTATHDLQALIRATLDTYETWLRADSKP